MSTLALLVIAGLVGFAFWLAFTRPRAALYVVIFLAPWQGLDVDLGLRVTAFQIFLAPLVVVKLFNFYLEGAIPPGGTTFALFMAFAILWSLSQVLVLPEAQVIGGVLRSTEVRALIQIVMFLFTISPLFLVPLIFRRQEELMSAGKVYLWSLCILATLGCIQLLIWYGTGTNPMPIGLVNGLLGGSQDARDGAYQFMDLSIYRMNSFGGEPKNLGGSLVIGMLIIQVVLMTMNTPFVSKFIYLWLFLAASTITTSSTTAFFLWIVGTATHLVMQSFLNVKYHKSKINGFQIIGVLLIPLGFLGIGAEVIGIPVGEILLDRTVNRVTESQLGVFEDFDDAIKNYLFDHPASAILGVGLGNIHLYADSYLATEVAVYAGGGVFVAKAQYLKFISEIGIIGFGLFLIWYWQLIYFTNRRLKTAIGPVNLIVLIPFGAANLLVYLAAGAGAPEFYLTAGIISAAYAMCRGAVK